MEFHKSQRSNSTHERYHAKYLIVGQGSGGLADRLKSMPYFVWLASRYNRTLLWHWDFPCRIENFLMPNSELFDWRVTRSSSVSVDQQHQQDTLDAWLLHQVRDKAVLINSLGNQTDYFEHLIGNNHDMAQHHDERFLKVYANHQTLTKGLPLLFAHAHHNPKVFSDVFRALLRPSPPIESALVSVQQELGILPPQPYIAVHLRARYPGMNKVIDAAYPHGTMDTKGFVVMTPAIEHQLQLMSQHALSCTQQRYAQVYNNNNNNNGTDKDVPTIYLATDTKRVTELYHDHPRVVSMPNHYHHHDSRKQQQQQEKDGAEPLHFVMSRKGGRQCHEYHPAFIDLFLLARSKCVGMGAGGYSLLASMMNGMGCFVFHQPNGMTKFIGESDPIQSFFHVAQPDGSFQIPQCLTETTTTTRQ